MWTPSLKVILFFCYFLQYDEVLLSSFLSGSYHYLVFMDPVHGYSKSKLLVKEQVPLKSKIRFSYVIPVVYFDQSSAHLLIPIKATKPFVLSMSLSDFFSVN